MKSGRQQIDFFFICSTIFTFNECGKCHIEIPVDEFISPGVFSASEDVRIIHQKVEDQGSNE